MKFFFLQSFNKLLAKSNMIDFDEIYSIETIDKVISEKQVLLSDHYIIDTIIEYYYQYHLIKAVHDKEVHFNGFPVRKFLNPTVKNVLKKL